MNEQVLFPPRLIFFVVKSNHLSFILQESSVFHKEAYNIDILMDRSLHTTWYLPHHIMPACEVLTVCLTLPGIWH